MQRYRGHTQQNLLPIAQNQSASVDKIQRSFILVLAVIYIFAIQFTILKYFYVLVSIFALFSFAFYVFWTARFPKHIFPLLLLLCTVLPSVFYAEYSREWAKSQYFSLLIRVLPALLFLNWMRAVSSVSHCSETVLAFSFAVALVHTFASQDILGNISNPVASLVIIFAPFALIRKPRLWFLVCLTILILFDARTSIAALAIQTAFLFLTKQKKFGPSIPILFGLAAIAVFFFSNISIFIPSELAVLGEDEWARRAMQFLSIEAIRNQPLTGIGMGQINYLMSEFTGRDMLAHGFIAYFWAQSGFFALLVFLGVSYFATSRAANYAWITQNPKYYALSAANLGAFILFITRPQQDNPSYFIILALGLACIVPRMKPTASDMN